MKTAKRVALTNGQKNGLWIAAGLLILAAVGWAAAPANVNKGDLSISLVAQKVVKQSNGQDQLQPAERAFPGEVIQYDALCHNQGSEALRRVEPTLPIPAGMVYVPDSAKPAPAQASLDGKNFQPIPLRRKVVLPNGAVELREVPATEYRALRWFIGEMAPGSKTTVIARTRLIPVTTEPGS